MTTTTLIKSLLVGLLWGSTNALLKAADDRRARSSSSPSNRRLPSEGTLADELRRALANPTWLFVFLLNQCGSLLFYYLLSTEDMSLVVPATQVATVMFTALAAYLLGERETRGVPSWRLALGMGLVCGGVYLLNVARQEK